MNLFSINSAVIRNANNQNYEITSINYVEIIYLIERSRGSLNGIIHKEKV